MSENSDAPLEGQDMKSNQELASVKSNGSNNFKFGETPWGTTRKRYEKSYSIEREDRKVDDKNGGKEEQLVLLKIKPFLRDKNIAASWNPFQRVDHPVLGYYWQRVSTQQHGRPPMPQVSQHVISLDLAACVRGDLEELGPLLSKLFSLKILRLNDNRTLTGDLKHIKGRQLLDLESISLMGTSIHSNRGLGMFESCKKMKCINIKGLSRVRGSVPSGLVNLPGLHLELQGSGMSGQDSIGNQARSAKVWALKEHPKVAHSLKEARVSNPNAKPYPLPSQINLKTSYALPPWQHGNKASNRRDTNSNWRSRRESPAYRSPAVPLVIPK